MQNIAIENNLSETAFAVKEGAAYHLRWFTPGGEVELCGHATPDNRTMQKIAIENNLYACILCIMKRTDPFPMGVGSFASYDLAFISRNLFVLSRRNGFAFLLRASPSYKCENAADHSSSDTNRSCDVAQIQETASCDCCSTGDCQNAYERKGNTDDFQKNPSYTLKRKCMTSPSFTT